MTLLISTFATVPMSWVLYYLQLADKKAGTWQEETLFQVEQLCLVAVSAPAPDAFISALDK